MRHRPEMRVPAPCQRGEAMYPSPIASALDVWQVGSRVGEGVVVLPRIGQERPTCDG
jgi:hypothetical protein